MKEINLRHADFVRFEGVGSQKLVLQIISSKFITFWVQEGNLRSSRMGSERLWV